MRCVPAHFKNSRIPVASLIPRAGIVCKQHLLGGQEYIDRTYLGLFWVATKELISPSSHLMWIHTKQYCFSIMAISFSFHDSNSVKHIDMTLEAA